MLVVRNLKDLQHHLNQTSTLHLGGWWRWLLALNAVVLTYIFVVTALRYAVEGYDPASYPASFNLAFGWGTVLFLAVAAVVLTMLRWRTEVDRFTPVPLEPYTDRKGEEVSA